MLTNIKKGNWAAAAFMLILVPISVITTFDQASAKTPHVAYVPGITLMPEVLLSDGATVRTYYTPQGLAYWSNDLPILVGDKIKLNLFAATGGAELMRVIVRSDNVKVAELNALPWNTVIDTASMATGFHMVEIWAEGTGDKPQSSTKTLIFFLARELPAQYTTKPATADLNTNLNAGQWSIDPSVPSEMPKFLHGRTIDPDATIILRSRDSAVDKGLQAGVHEIALSGSTVFYIETPKGSDAAAWTYVLSRGDKSIVASATPLNPRSQRLRIQPRTDTTPGLRSGPVTLWIWGIDQSGNPSSPAKVRFVIP
jgi:hypothetical protein